MESFLDRGKPAFGRSVSSFDFPSFAGGFWLLLKKVLKSSRIVPWRFIHSWKCVNCGECCRKYNVNLAVDEWLRIVRIYGEDVVVSNLGKLVLRRRVDGSCVFLYSAGGRWICGLQSIKPRACMLWPFYVKEKPVYGYGELAYYNCNRLDFYIYVDMFCKGLTYGLPSKEILDEVLPEVVEIYLGRRVKQQYTTSKLNFRSLWGKQVYDMIKLFRFYW
ncbi:MAG: YkgJ family cysteine cluster protein [Candidatus Bathyarchaeota archaeon]|nr:YkgJ family cysteine cluster protein [Candidatus Bathyarchaeota archaeon]